MSNSLKWARQFVRNDPEKVLGRKGWWEDMAKSCLKSSHEWWYSKSLPFLLLLPRKKGILQRLVVVKGERVGEDMDWKFGISRCKLVLIEWINKVLLYVTGNYIQYPII